MAIPNIGFAQASSSSQSANLQDTTYFSPTLILGSPEASIANRGEFAQSSEQEAFSKATATATPPGLFGGGGGGGDIFSDTALAGPAERLGLSPLVLVIGLGALAYFLLR